MKNLLAIRKEFKISQNSLALKIGVSQESVSGYENGTGYPTVNTLLKICDLFHVSADYLLDKTDIRTPVSELMVEELKPIETEIIKEVRELPSDMQQRALGIILGLKDSKIT